MIFVVILSLLVILIGNKGKKLFFLFVQFYLTVVYFFRFRLEDVSLANCKLQQGLKIKEEKITELETKYDFFCNVLDSQINFGF